MADEKPVSLPVSSVDNLIGLCSSKSAPYASPEAFHHLYECTHVSVFRYIYSLYGGPLEDVEDLTAETFARAWQGRTRFWGDTDAATGWLITIARNLVIDTQRQHHRHAALAAIDDLELEPATEMAVERHVVWSEQQEVLLAALQTLPIQEREMVILRYVLGWQVKRIAAHYDMLENTISVKLRRALEQLRRQWPDLTEDEQ